MKASELITILGIIIAKHGDMIIVRPHNHEVKSIDDASIECVHKYYIHIKEFNKNNNFINAILIK